MPNLGGSDVTPVTDQLSGTVGLASYPAAAAPANGVSIAEAVRAIYDRQLGDGTDAATNSIFGKRVSKTTATLPATTTQNIFTVSGGRVAIRLLLGEVTTVVQAQACNLKVTSAPTVGTAVDLAANLDINAKEVGTLFLVEGDGTALVGANAGAALSAIGSALMVVPAGTIRIETSATNTGATKWDLFYVPLDNGASVASA